MKYLLVYVSILCTFIELKAQHEHPMPVRKTEKPEKENVPANVKM